MNVIQTTEQLKELLKKSKNSGQIYWNIGKMLYYIWIEESFRPMHLSFNSYLNEDVGIDESIASDYINIYVFFDKDEITESMLVSHIRYLIHLKNKPFAKKLLAAMKKCELIQTIKETMSTSGGNDNQFSFIHMQADYSYLTDRELLNYSIENLQNIINTLHSYYGWNIQKERKPLKPPYIKEDIELVTNLLLRTHENLEKISQEEIEINLQEQTQKRESEKIKKRLELVQFGEPLYSDYFELGGLCSNAPIDEQGTVALFCVLFHLLRDIDFYFNNKEMRLHQIVYVRQKFPDAKIQCRFFEKSKNCYILAEINVEFEFEGSNYLKHKHHIADEKCDMIICWHWENRLTTEQFRQHPLPPIMEIKKILETGHIFLCNHSS